MAKNRIFSSSAKRASRAKSTEKAIKTDYRKLENMTKRQLISYIKKIHTQAQNIAQMQAERLSGFRASGFRDFELQKYSDYESLQHMNSENLRRLAEKGYKTVTGHKRTITAAKEERHNKLDALRNLGISNPRTEDLYVFWDSWDELIDEGLPPYLEKQVGQDVNGLYSLAETFIEFKRLPKSERTKETLKELAINRFKNIQRSQFGMEYDEIVKSAEENWKMKHPGKKLNRQLSNEELRIYSTYGV